MGASWTRAPASRASSCSHPAAPASTPSATRSCTPWAPSGYLERWQGRSPRALPAAPDFADLDAIRARWERIERDTHAFVAGLTDDALARVLEYTNMQGERWAYPLWQQMLHQVNHATQHRSEAAMMLTRLGHSPGWLDLLYFVDQVGASDEPVARLDSGSR